MNKTKFLANQKYFSYLSIVVSLSLMTWSHFDKVQREHKRAQQQATVEAIERDCAQLQRESGAFYRHAKALIAKDRLSDEDASFARHYDEKSRAFDARYAEIQRRCREFNATVTNQ